MGVAGEVFVKGMYQAFVGVLAVAVGSGAASLIVLGRKSGWMPSTVNGHLHVTINVYARPWYATDSGTSGDRRIRTIDYPVGDVSDGHGGRVGGAVVTRTGEFDGSVRTLSKAMVLLKMGSEWSVAEGGTAGEKQVIPATTWVRHAPCDQTEKIKCN